MFSVSSVWNPEWRRGEKTLFMFVYSWFKASVCSHVPSVKSVKPLLFSDFMIRFTSSTQSVCWSRISAMYKQIMKHLLIDYDHVKWSHQEQREPPWLNRHRKERRLNKVQHLQNNKKASKYRPQCLIDRLICVQWRNATTISSQQQWWKHNKSEGMKHTI